LNVNETARKFLVGEFSLRRLMTSLLLIPFFVYLGLLVFAYFYADKVIFQPQFSSYKDNEEILKLKTSDGDKISARFYENPNAEHTILFSHGNAEDIDDTDFLMREFQQNGFSVLAYDYRGYGTSEGTPSEEKVYRDIDAAYDHLTRELNILPEKIVLYGRSLGGAVAIDLASRKKVGALIAESTFVSAFRVLTKIQLTPFDKFESLKKIKNVNCPVLIIHGRRDRTVPFRHGEKLFAEANEPKFSLWLDEADHNNVFSVGGKAYLQTTRDFADNLSK
jgi:abhydrolase domain-containing protein 17